MYLKSCISWNKNECGHRPAGEAGPVSVVTFLSTLVNTQPAAGESWTDKIYVKPVAFLVLWWFSMVLGASKIGSLLHIVLANSCPFLQIFLCTTKSVTLCFLNFVFLFSGSIFRPMFYIRIASEQPPHRRMHGGEIVNIAPLLSHVPAIVHSLFVIASAPVWSAKCAICSSGINVIIYNMQMQ